jgi:Uma2 family endonuclease
MEGVCAMLLNERLYTADEFWELCQLPENVDKHWELIEGTIYEMSPAGIDHSRLGAILVRWIGNYLDENNLGIVVGADAGFRITPRSVFSPDVAFISHAKLKDGVPKNFAKFAPDIAIEIVSPGNTQSEINQKTKLYLQHGTRLVWIVYPEQKEVHVYRAENDPHKASITYLGIEDTLSGEDILPNFTLSLTKLFA